ncbi:DUF1120 domain-containing protein [Stenotrophomonas maltophilia]|uniref:DUF1120 domain-containing protein n=1 Tax=Stenotrophomonas maltophilia TaxID=40324 RepID=UPI002AA12203|nr:DUF1120 domain-containing protein [Stenotrophomonas maltophilia]
MKLKQYSLIGLAISAALASATTSAAETADITVSGTLSPSACDLALTRTNFEIGRVSFDDLNETEPTALTGGSRGAAISVNCTADTKFALQVIDNKSGTANADVVSALGSEAAADRLFGLGTDSSGNNIGGYLVRFNQTATGDAGGDTAVAAQNVNTSDGSTWSRFGSRAIVPSIGRAGWAVTSGSSVEPDAFTSIDGSLSIQPAVAALEDLDGGSAIDLDGNATVVLHYL